MTKSNMSDIVIIGDGIIGLSLAVEIQRRDPTLRVLALGSSERRCGASQAAGAMLGNFGEITRSSLKSEAGQKKFQMGRLATSMWPSWLEYLSSDQGPTIEVNEGTFVFTNNRSSVLEDENYLAILETLKSHDEPHELVDPSNIDFLIPDDDSRASNVVYIPGEGSVDASAVLLRMKDKISLCENMRILEGEAKSIQINKGGSFGVVLNTGEVLESSKIVVATGASSSELLRSIVDLRDEIPPMFSGMGTSLIVSQPDKRVDRVIRTPNRAFACGFHALPRIGQSLYLGATNNIHMESIRNPSISDIHFLMECAMEQLNHQMFDCDVLSATVGNRPITLDTYPLLGSTIVPGLFVATGTYRDGFHLSPLIAQMMTKLILDYETSPELEFFNLHRSYIESFTLDEAIDQTAKYYSAVGFEHGIKIPKVGWHEMFDEYFREKAVSLYNELEADVVLHPDLFSLIDQDRDKMVPVFKKYLRNVNRVSK